MQMGIVRTRARVLTRSFNSVNVTVNGPAYAGPDRGNKRAGNEVRNALVQRAPGVLISGHLARFTFHSFGQ